MPHRLLLILAVCGGLALGGCATPRHMTKAAGPPPAQIPEGKTRMIFMRPSGFAGGVTFTIIDEDGSFIGDIAAKSQFAVDVDPGKRLYLVWAENAGPLHAEMEAGKTYLVHVAPRMGMWSARAHLLAYKPGAEDWDEKDEWCAKLRWWKPDTPAGQAMLDGRKEDVIERIADAREVWADYDEEEKAERTLSAADGQ